MIGSIRVRVARIVLLLENCLIALVAQALWGKKRHEPNCITIFKAGNIGDLLCAIPAIEEIRRQYPKARLILFTNGGTSVDARYVYQNYDTLDAICVYVQKDTKSYAGIRKVAMLLNEQNSDYTIYLSAERAKPKSVLRDMAIIKLAHVKFAEGFKISTVRLFAKEQNSICVFDREVIRQLESLPFPYEYVSFHFPIGDTDRDYVDTYLVRNDLIDKPLLLLSMRGKAAVNQWPTERFSEIAKRWDAGQGLACIVIGGPEQRDFITTHMMREDTVNAGGMFSIAQSIYLISKSELLITVDTGTAHMASLTGTKCIVISSSYYFSEKWMPYGNHITVMRAAVDCSPCLRETCKYGDNRCINSISVDMVWNRIKELTNLEK